MNFIISSLYFFMLPGKISGRQKSLIFELQMELAIPDTKIKINIKQQKNRKKQYKIHKSYKLY